MSDKTDAEVLFPSMAQAAPVAPPVEAKPANQTPATTTAPQMAADATTTEHTTTDQTTPPAEPVYTPEVLAFQEQQAAEWHTLTRETWVNETKADPEIGGEKFTGAVTDAKRFLEQFGDAEVRQFLEQSGFGNNKFVIRLFSRAQRGMPGGAGAGSKPTKTDSQVLYPGMNP